MENKPSIPSEIQDKIEAEANWRATSGHGAVDNYIYTETKSYLEYGYSLAASQISKLEADLKEKEGEIANYKTVMIAAAEEIQAHWDAHCDTEGYGPANLMYRLEKGIPSQYGYTSGKFEQMKSRISDLEKELGEEKDNHWSTQILYDAAKKGIEQYEKELQSQSEIISKLREGLEELVLVKHLKDLEGKTDEYLHRQPKAWDKAKQLLSETKPH
jgi:chromosome segregation ATPase